MRKREPFTEDQIREVAARYTNLSDFRAADKAMYNRALQLGMVESLGLMKKKRRGITDNEFLVEAEKYQSNREFEKADPGLHSTFRRRGLHKGFKFPGARRALDDYELFALARQYPTRSQFQHGDAGAYDTARRRGLLDEMFSGFREGYGDYDALYVVLAKGVFFNGEQVYKIGLTSARLGLDRIRKLRCHSKMEFEIITLVSLIPGTPSAQLEKRLHAIGTDPKLIKFSGSTEFRALSPEQLGVVLDQISMYSAANIQP